ncbi:MAG TPA: SMP-30/gluconolactonase/LRE family protein [Caldimonas sp.]|nr:SMP-30/gluconolactonase/LRE family protein [Caldimonas sp.]
MPEVLPVDVVAPLRCRLGESPVWSAGERVLWWVDIEGRALHRLEPASGRITTWHATERIGCVALHAGGGLIGALEDGIWRLHPREGGLLEAQRLATVEHAHDGMRFNDGRCDRAGRLWAMTMVRDIHAGVAAGALYRYDARGLSAPVLSGFVIGNGIAFSPDNRTMYFSDAHASVRRIWAADLQDDGTLSNRREFVDMNRHAGRPDGAAVDADGCYWICATDAGAILRFTPGGRLDRAVKVPVAKPTMCAFGGTDGRDLWVTSLTPPAPPPGYDSELAGALLHLRPGPRGLEETPFAA